MHVVHPFPSNIHTTTNSLPTVWAKERMWCFWDRCIAQGPLISKLCLTHLALCREDNMYMYEFSGARKEANKQGREICGEWNEERQLGRRDGLGGGEKAEVKA